MDLGDFGPVSGIMLYCGIKREVLGQFCKGNEKTWWAVSSCKAKLKVLENDMFLLGKALLFHIVTTCVFNITSQRIFSETQGGRVCAPNNEILHKAMWGT